MRVEKKFQHMLIIARRDEPIGHDKAQKFDFDFFFVQLVKENDLKKGAQNHAIFTKGFNVYFATD